MIIQSLVALYDRLFENGDVPPYGFSVEDIGFVISINSEGQIIGEPQDLRNKVNANKYEFFKSIVPYTNHVNVRSGNASTTPNFMVDKADYIFGMSGTAQKKIHHQSFIDLVKEVCSESDDPGANAVLAFLKNWNSEDSTKLSYWKDICGIHGKWIAFRFENERQFVHERPAVKKMWIDYISKIEYSEGRDLLSGKVTSIQPQYAQFKFGSGASLVSFNEKAYESYGKTRGENAPIGVEGEFKSSTALKWLFRNKVQRLYIGDATTIFWTENESPVEEFIGLILNPRDVLVENNQKLNSFLKAAQKGTKPQELSFDEKMKFYILGLSLNKARLAVRFWHVCNVDQLMKRIGKHFNDLEMERQYESYLPYPGVWHLLKETARKTEDISPLLGGALMRSILEGTSYPQNLYTGVLNRIRADQEINYLKAAILKAVLKRNYKKEVPMSLDLDRREPAYLLGRLFAVLEKAQLDALGKVNATIKDRFFSAASATPGSVFPRLLRLSQFHIEKTEYGYVSEKRISEIMENINYFPAHLNMQDQGLFAIAYYQQKNDLYKKKKTNLEGEKNV
ncbi:type I-C CRISPR-associated protein Cas8c/Csd1 [bacterium]|nr:type I-C CRISPR-associated protein Cas8c/Csd1 [bacterium]